MALSATTTLPHTVDSVAAVLVNEDFQRHVSELVGGTLESFTVDGDIAGAFSTTSVRTLPTTRLPEIARKFVGETLKVTQVENWDAPAADGSRQSNISLKICRCPRWTSPPSSASWPTAAAPGSSWRATSRPRSRSSAARSPTPPSPWWRKALNLQATAGAGLARKPLAVELPVFAALVLIIAGVWSLAGVAAVPAPRHEGPPGPRRRREGHQVPDGARGAGQHLHGAGSGDCGHRRHWGCWVNNPLPFNPRSTSREGDLRSCGQSCRCAAAPVRSPGSGHPRRRPRKSWRI